MSFICCFFLLDFKKKEGGIKSIKIKILNIPDIFLIGAFIVFAGAFYFLFDLSPKNPETAIIRLNGEIFEIVPLNKEKDVEIYSGGTLLNTVRIQGGKAFMIYASCPDKRCMKQNYFIACLPNKVTVETAGAKNGFDIII